MDIELPFRIDLVRWAGPPPLEARQLAGSYRYTRASTQHALVVDGVDLAKGHYGARIGLQGAAPMALNAVFNGRVRAPLAEDRSIDIVAQATVRGTLAGESARLAVEARVRPAEPADAAAATIASASAELVASGFSHSTCLPAAKNGKVVAKCAASGVTLVTASNWPQAMASSMDAKPWGM